MVSLSSSPPFSGLEHIYSSDLYPMNGVCSNSESPFPLLPGEYLTYIKPLDCSLLMGNLSDDFDEPMFAVITNYRFFLRMPNSFINITLSSIESVECKEIFYVQINCKNAQAYRCCFNTNELCLELHAQLSTSMVNQSLERLEHVFAFGHYAWISNSDPNYSLKYKYDQTRVLNDELKRMGFDLEKCWRISSCNDNHKLCDTYPALNVIPNWITDTQLELSSKFRACNRFPVVVWRCQDTGSVIARCSQPEVGLLGWRNAADEKLLHSFAVACQMNLPEKVFTSDKDEASRTMKRLLIIDARSYTAAVANRAKGGGCECSEYYSNCEIQYMGLANIHSIRKSFNALRTLCIASDQSSWLSSLEQSKWLSHISNLIRSALVICRAVQESRSIIVHCSDGWDRTPQIIAITELLMDPYYRTIEGFIVLIEREWLDYGHKFADRCGTGVRTDDLNERCPVFIQWLDCVFQLIKQFPTCFQFNESFLIKLVQHTYSCLYGTFLCNSTKQRKLSRVEGNTVSVWCLLIDNPRYINLLYQPSDSNKIIHPCFNVRSLHIWSAIWFNVQSTPLTSLTSGASSASLADRSRSQDNNKSKSCEDITAEFPADNRRYKIVAPSITDNGAAYTCGRRLSDTVISSPRDHLETAAPSTSDVEIETTIERLDDDDELRPGNESLVLSNGLPCELRAVPDISQPMNIPTLRLLNPSCHGSTDTLTSSPLTSPDTLASIASRRLCNDHASITKCTIGTSTGDISDSNVLLACSDDTIFSQLSNLIITNNDAESSETSSGINEKYPAPLSSNSIPSNKNDAFWYDDDSTMDSSILFDSDGLITWQSHIDKSLLENDRKNLAEKAILKRQLCYLKNILKQYGENLKNVSETVNIPINDETPVEKNNSPVTSDNSWEQVNEKEADIRLWVPDHAVTHCNECHQKFWIVRRRHHCRNCGHVICAECTYYTPVPNQYLTKPVRVCKRCFNAPLAPDSGLATPEVTTPDCSE